LALPFSADHLEGLRLNVFSARSLAVLIGLLALCVGGGALIGIVTAGNIDAWYATLQRPSWTPPNWLFGPAWTLLYTLMAIAMWLVWCRIQTHTDAGSTNEGQPNHRGLKNNVRRPIALFAIQLTLNFLWTPVFFGAHQIGLGMIIIGSLVVAVAITIVSFRPWSQLAGWLMVPYLAWVIYASTLNGGFLALNGW